MPRDYITSIFNYCDYWCDRCAFTRRCRNYAMAEEEKRDAALGKGRTDEENRAVWDSLDGVLARARGQLEELTAQRIDEFMAGEFEEPTAEEMLEYEEEYEKIHKKVKAHFASKASMAYMQEVGKWLESAKSDVAEAAETLVNHARFTPGTGQGEAQRQLDELQDLLDMVTWYHTLLPPKIMRMLQGLFELPGKAAWCDGSDVYGTGKLLLVSIDRSIAAWTKLRDFLPKQEDAILGFLIRLDHLRRAIEHDVPQARAHIRPGLDE